MGLVMMVVVVVVGLVVADDEVGESWLECVDRVYKQMGWNIDCITIRRL